MEKATARRLFDLLQKLGNESTPYSRVETLRRNELQGFIFNSGKYPSLGACLISDRTSELWFVITDYENGNNYNIVIIAKNKQQCLAVIHQEEWTYKPGKQDRRNKERKKRFESIFESKTVPIPFPKNEDGICDFLNRVFDVATIRRWADNLEDEPSPELRSFPERDQGTRIQNRVMPASTILIRRSRTFLSIESNSNASCTLSDGART